MAQLASKPVPGFPDFTGAGRCGDVDAFFKAHDDALKALQATAAALPEGEYVGALIRFGVADGYAVYRVKSLKPLVLEHVPFGDAYQISVSHIRGLRVTDVKALIDSERRMSKLFGRR